MNKKLNTALFMIGATLFNILLLLLFMAVGLVGISALKMPQFLLFIWFFVALVCSFLIYNQLVKFIARKVDMEKYFLPLFKRKPPRKDASQ